MEIIEGTDEFALIRTLRKDGVLQDIDTKKMMDIIEPTGLICCSDGHQRDDINTHIRSIWGEVEAELNIHEIKFAGAQIFAAKSHITNPLFNEHLFIRDQVVKGKKLGKIKKRVIKIGHWECGLVREYNLSLFDALLLQTVGREELQREFPDLVISNAFHVNYKNGLKRTYHFDSTTGANFIKNYSDYDTSKAMLFASATA